MNLKSGFEDRRARIEVIPLMDVMFLLLVFFIYGTLSMTVSRGVDVDLPQGGTPRADDKPIVISLTAEDKLFLDEQPMPRDELLATVLSQWRDKPSSVLIKADRAAPLGTGVELVSKLKEAGVARIAFETRAEQP